MDSLEANQRTDDELEAIISETGRWAVNGRNGALVHMQDGARNDLHPDRLCDDAHATDGVRASRRQHLVQYSHADGCLGLLCGEATCP
jgi:hypothetical protein